MDKYEELIAVFSETLEQSRDYHIAYMYQVGYVSVLGLFYKNRKLLGCQDFENICNLDNKIPDLLQKEYRQSIQILQNKIHIALQVEN